MKEQESRDAGRAAGEVKCRRAEGAGKEAGEIGSKIREQKVDRTQVGEQEKVKPVRLTANSQGD